MIIIVTLINRGIPHENNDKYKLMVLQISRSGKQIIIQFNRIDKVFCAYMYTYTSYNTKTFPNIHHYSGTINPTLSNSLLP